jgi:hypothetical protein
VKRRPLRRNISCSLLAYPLFFTWVNKEADMSIRMIAKNLYRFQREVETLEKRLADAPMEEQEALKDRLRKLKFERNRIRSALDGAKDAPTYPVKPHR